MSDDVPRNNQGSVCGLAESYALGSLTNDEKVAFEKHVQDCLPCASELEEATESIRNISTGVPIGSGARARFMEALRRATADDPRHTGAAVPSPLGKHSKKRKTVLLGMRGEETTVHECDHIAYFWETERQFNDAVGFLETGFRGEDHCVVFGYEEANAKVLSILQEQGLNVQQLIAKGRLSVLSAERTGDATLEKIGSTFRKSLEAGAAMVRLLGNIGWCRPKWPDEADILAFEANVTAAAGVFPCVIVCMYDINALKGKTIMRGGLETHPVTIRGNVVRENPYYVPTEDFLRQLRNDIALGAFGV